MKYLFDKTWFKDKQKLLLWFLNTKFIRFWFRRMMRIDCKYYILQIQPNNYKFYDGKFHADFRTHDKYSKRLFYAFYPLWWIFHQWDILIANQFNPAWNIGFDTLTAYPDADPETLTIDGVVIQQYGAGSGQSWATIIGLTNGNAVDDTSTAQTIVQINSDSGTDNWRTLLRGFFLFDTSSIDDAAIVTAAVLSLFGSGKADNLSITPNIDIYTSNPSSNTGLATGDYNQVGSVSQTGSPITYAGWSTTAYNDFTFNATGRENVSKTGISKFGCRNANYDVAAQTPTWSASASSSLTAYNADQTGTTSDPKLVVTYSLSAGGLLSFFVENFV